MKKNGNVTYVWIGMVSSLRVETMSTKEVRGCAGDIGVDNIGNGPGKDGRVRGTYLIGTTNLYIAPIHQQSP